MKRGVRVSKARISMHETEERSSTSLMSHSGLQRHLFSESGLFEKRWQPLTLLSVFRGPFTKRGLLRIDLGQARRCALMQFDCDVERCTVF